MNPETLRLPLADRAEISSAPDFIVLDYFLSSHQIQSVLRG
jgi:hypothetical protein